MRCRDNVYIKIQTESESSGVAGGVVRPGRHFKGGSKSKVWGDGKPKWPKSHSPRPPKKECFPDCEKNFTPPRSSKNPTPAGCQKI